MAFIPFFVFGTIVGSFLNVVGLRYRSGKTVGGRSACASCATTLRWWELVPVISFFYLRGRCATCGSRISWQYPLVELWTGLVFATLAPIYWPVFCIYIVITIYDLRHKIIPDGLVYSAIIYALILRIAISYQLGAISWFDWSVGPILFALFAFGWLVSRGRALGFGDAKLVLSVGLLSGGYQALSAMALAFWIGTAVTLPLVLLGVLFGKKKLTIKSEIPFAPFIIAGAWVSLLFDLDIFHVLSFTN